MHFLPVPLFCLLTLSSFVHDTKASGSIVPLYVYPGLVDGRHTWEPLIEAAATLGNHPSTQIWAIVNPANGSGSSIDRQYTDGIQKLVAAKIKVLGYVYSSYGKRNKTKIHQEVDNWKKLYPLVTGIFVDEMDNKMSPTILDYYKALNSYIISSGFVFSVGNPGVAVNDAQLIEIFNTTVIYENVGLPSRDTLNAATFPASDALEANPSLKYTVMAYNVAALDLRLMNFIQMKAGYVFIQTMDTNPWNFLPTLPFIMEQFQQFENFNELKQMLQSSLPKCM